MRPRHASRAVNALCVRLQMQGRAGLANRCVLGCPALVVEALALTSSASVKRSGPAPRFFPRLAALLLHRKDHAHGSLATGFILDGQAEHVAPCRQRAHQDAKPVSEKAVAVGAPERIYRVLPPVEPRAGRADEPEGITVRDPRLSPGWMIVTGFLAGRIGVETNDRRWRAAKAAAIKAGRLGEAEGHKLIVVPPDVADEVPFS